MNDSQSDSSVVAPNDSLSDEDIERIKNDPDAIQEIIQHHKISVAQMYKGPIPQASDLSEYASIDPSFPNRIMEMAEKEGEHRRSIEAKLADLKVSTSQEDLRIEKMGLIFGFLITLVCLISGVFLITNGNSLAGLSTVISSLALLIGSFLHSAKKKEDRNEDKNEE